LDLDFNDLFLLECFYYQEDRNLLRSYTIPSLKDYTLSSRFQHLKKMEYLVDDPNNTNNIIISVKGKNIIEALIVGKLVSSLDITPTEINKDDLFEEWWKLYPTTPGWSNDDKTISFIGSRNLKNLRKAEAKKRYLKLLNQGLVHDELVGSLKYEMKIKKLDSIKKNANQMEYFKGMDSYFNSERYLQHIDDYKRDPDFVKDENGKIKSRKSNVKDI
jgi:hypothetical protein